MSELSELLDKVKGDIQPELLRPAIAEALMSAGVAMYDLRRICQLWADNALVAKIDKTDWPGPDATKAWIKPILQDWTAGFVAEMFDKFFERPA